jgi:hypothetical protein
MIHRRPAPLYLGENPAVVCAPRAAMRAYLALMAALGGCLTAVMLMMSVAANSGSEADRITATQDNTYPATLAAALTVNLSKPLR